MTELKETQVIESSIQMLGCCHLDESVGVDDGAVGDVRVEGRALRVRQPVVQGRWDELIAMKRSVLYIASPFVEDDQGQGNREARRQLYRGQPHGRLVLLC